MSLDPTKPIRTVHGHCEAHYGGALPGGVKHLVAYKTADVWIAKVVTGRQLQMGFENEPELQTRWANIYNEAYPSPNGAWWTSREAADANASHPERVAVLRAVFQSDKIVEAELITV